MSCKYLTKRTVIEQGVPGDDFSFSRQEVDVPACRLMREPDEMEWGGRCRRNAPSGPCWLWVELYGDRPDPEFYSQLFVPVLRRAF